MAVSRSREVAAILHLSTFILPTNQPISQMADTLPAQPATDAAAEPTQAANISRDGAKIADMEYYDLLGVRGDATGQ